MIFDEVVFLTLGRTVRELEHRIAAIIAEALDASTTLPSALGVLVVFQAVVKRKIIETELQTRLNALPIQVPCNNFDLHSQQKISSFSTQFFLGCFRRKRS